MAAAFRKSVTEFLRNTKSFERVVNQMKIKTLENGRCVAELKVGEEHTNSMGGLHGGFSATLVDQVSSIAINTHPKVGFDTDTVSIDIHTSYLKGAKVGDEIEIDAKTLRAGKTLGFLEVDIRNKATGELLVRGSHTVFIMHPKK